MNVSRLSDAAEYLSAFSAVIFDLDDTLYSEKDYVRSGYAEIARHYPQIENMAEKLWAAFESGEKAIDFVLSQEGLLSPENLSRCVSLYRNHMPQITAYPQATDLLRLLRSKNIRLGLITDGRPEGQRAKIAALQLGSFFEKIIITDELGGVSFRKPNPEAFRQMQCHFGVPFEKMVYVGDNPQKDFTAPKLLGMGAVYFENPQGLYTKK